MVRHERLRRRRIKRSGNAVVSPASPVSECAPALSNLRYWSIVGQAMDDARRLGLRVSNSTLTAIGVAQGYSIERGKLRPWRPTDTQSRTLALSLPPTWPVGKILKARSAILKAIRTGRPVRVRVQYEDGRVEEVMEAAPWAIDSPTRQRSTITGRIPLVGDATIKAELRKTPKALPQALADRLLSAVPAARWPRSRDGIRRPPSRWMKDRLRKRIERIRQAHPSV